MFINNPQAEFNSFMRQRGRVLWVWVIGIFAAITLLFAASEAHAQFPPPTMTVAVNPSAVLINAPATLTYTLRQFDNTLGAIVRVRIIFPNTFALVNAITNTCGSSPVVGPVPPPPAGFNQFFFDLGSVPAGTTAFCTFTANVRSASAGTFTFVVVPGDLELKSAEPFNKNTSITTLSVTAAVTIAPIITSGAPPAGTVGAPYSFTFTATGTTPITWSVAAGTLPAGVTLNAATGVLSGAPLTAGTFGFLVQASNGTLPNATQNDSIVVSANAPVVSLAPTTLTFASQTVFTTSPAQTVTLTNSGTANLILNVPTSTGPFAFTTTCPFLTPPVAPGGTCTFTITFTPALAGAATGTIDFFSNAPSSPTAIALSGTGSAVAVPGVAVTPVPPTPLTFAAQTVASSSASQNIVLTNTGTANLLINAINITAGALDFARVLPSSGPTNCAGVLAPAAQCAIAIIFTPQAVGASAGNVQIVTNASPTSYNVPLSGTGSAALVGLLSVSGPINFGDQIIGTQSVAQTVFISNVGNGFVFVNSVSLAGLNAADFQSTGNCGGLVPGASCAVSVSFNPSTIGPNTAQLAIGSNALNAATVNAVALSGNGVPFPRPLAALSATAVGFGNTIFGGSAAPQTIALTNNGTLPLLIQSTITSAEYTQTNNCPASLNPQASCAISLSFTPFGLGPRAGEFVLNSNTADSPNRVLLGGNGCRWFKPPGTRLYANICQN